MCTADASDGDGTGTGMGGGTGRGSNCSERQDRAPQAQDVEHHTGKIRNTLLGRVPSWCA